MHLLNVTDGLMVQVTMEALADLRRSLRDMKDFTVTCGKLPPAERQEYVHIQWQDEEPRFNKGLETNIYIYIYSYSKAVLVSSHSALYLTASSAPLMASLWSLSQTSRPISA